MYQVIFKTILITNSNSECFQVIDLVGQEHVDLNYKQLEELVSMMAKEELLEQEKK